MAEPDYLAGCHGAQTDFDCDHGLRPTDYRLLTTDDCPRFPLRPLRAPREPSSPFCPPLAAVRRQSAMAVLANQGPEQHDSVRV